MTTIIYHDGEFAWDTQTTWQDRAMTGGDKVFRNGPVVFGVSGLGRTSDVLRYMEVPALRDFEPDFDTRKWIVNTLAPAILKEVKGVDVAETVNGQSSSGAQCILYVNGIVGYLSGNLSFVEDETGFYAVGSGSPYALGALKAGASVKDAVEAAIFFDLYSGGEARTLLVNEKEGK